jgi:hypothetical protein
MDATAAPIEAGRGVALVATTRGVDTDGTETGGVDTDGIDQAGVDTGVDTDGTDTGGTVTDGTDTDGTATVGSASAWLTEARVACEIRESRTPIVSARRSETAGRLSPRKLGRCAPVRAVDGLGRRRATPDRFTCTASSSRNAINKCYPPLANTTH